MTLSSEVVPLQTVGERQQRLVIVNLQRTPLDPVARLRIFAKCDDVSKLLMGKLGLTIPEFRLKRYPGGEGAPGGTHTSGWSLTLLPLSSVGRSSSQLSQQTRAG